MGYDFEPINEEVEWFHLGAFSWPVLLEYAFGTLFPSLHSGGRWYCCFGADKRMPEGDDYPRIISNDGFHVTDEEAKIMARMTRNFVTIQKSLGEENRPGGATVEGSGEFKKDDVMEALIRGMHGGAPGPWPVKIRDDFTEKFERFAEWMETSGGFKIH
jgi:hypothetical protein